MADETPLSPTPATVPGEPASTAEALADAVAAEQAGTAELSKAEQAALDEAERPGWKRTVAAFLVGQTVSLFGSMLVQYAVIWYLTLTSESGGILALAMVFGFLPQAIVSIFGGVWADRMNRKVLIVIADSGIAIATVTLALFMLAGITDYSLIFAALAIRSIGAGIQTPAVSALIPQITPTSQLLRVNGLFGSIQAAMALLAPAVAAVVYSSFSLVAIFFIDAATAVIGVLLLIALVPVPTIVRADAGQTGYFTDLVEGVRYIWTHGFVRWLLVLFAIVFVLTVAPSTLTPLMVPRSFSDEPWFQLDDGVGILAVLEISFSVGMMLGGIAIAVWGGLKNRALMIAGSSVLFGLLSIGLGLSTNLIMFFGIMFLVGLAVPFFSTPAMTLLQEIVPPERHGRVFGFVGIVMALAMPFGMVVFGPLADVIPVEQVLIIAGVITFLVVGLALLTPSGISALRHGGPAPEVVQAIQEEAAAPTVTDADRL